ncbi:MAG: hypothetical protein EBS96_12300 [Spartobacteria bacterium]|nr:hypothetical protein [Spartobacteria bacterium]
MLPIAILSGGLATRLRPLTERIPKALIEVAGRPFVDWQLELLAAAGIKRVVFCVGYLGEMIEAHVGEGARFGLEVAYCYDGPTLLGTGGALRQALHLLGEEFLVLYGDSHLPIDYAAVTEAFLKSNKLGLMTVLKNEGRWDSCNVWMAGRHARSRKMPTSASSAIPIIPKDQAPHVPPEHYCKNSFANLDTNFGTIRFRSSTRENSQRYPAQKISLTTTYSPSRSKIAGNSSLSTKESTQVYCKAAFPPIMLLKTILECKNRKF